MKRCFECGAELPVGTPGNRCPGCVLRLGLDASCTNEAPTAGLDVTDRQAISLGRVKCFGDYELLEEIARGGMGIVYKARQVSLNRLVAVKMILFGELAGKSVIERFQREAEAAAQLQHPHIVAVHEVGEHEGQHYFSMDYVAGPNLAKMVGSRPLPVRRAARYVELIAGAIAYAHGRGVLHRDLKPSNVLIDPTDQPQVTDFGLAKSLAGDSELTVSGQVLGTPNYLPPEQAAGRRGTAGPASDVYGLGAILYFLIAARPPFVGESLETTLGQVLHQEPVSPRLLNGSVPRDLETICLKCLEKEPARRYPTAQALADELGRFQRGEPIQARPIGVAGKAWRWCRRKPVVAGLTGALGLALVLGFAGVTWQWRQAEHERKLQRRVAYAAGVRAAQSALQQSDLGAVVALLDQQRPGPSDQEDLRGIEWRYLWQESQGDEVASFSHPHWVRDAAISPDGRYLVTSCYDSKIRVLDCASGRILREFESMSPMIPVNCLGFAMDGQWLVIPGKESGIEIRETTGWNILNRLPSSQPPLCLSANGRFLVADGGGPTDSGESLVLWDLRSGTQQRLTEAAARYRNLAISRDGSQVAYSTNDPYISRLPGAIFLRELESGLTHILATNELTISLAMSPDGKWLATGHYASGEICFWDLATRQRRATFTAHRGAAVTLAFSPDSRVLASGGIDQLIQLWQTGTSNPPIATFRGHLNAIHFCTFSQDGKVLVSTSTDRTAKLWNLQPRPTKGSSFTLPANTIAFGALPDGSALLAVDEQKTRTYLLSLPEGQPLGSNAWEHVAQQGCQNLRFFVRNQSAVGVDTNGTVHFYDLTTGTHQFAVPLGEGGFTPELLSPDNRWLLGTSGASRGKGAGEATLWDLRAAHGTLRLQLPALHFFAAGFSPDSRWLAYSDTTNAIHLWDLSAGHEEPPLKTPGRGHAVVAIRFSPDARMLAIGGWDGLWLWSMKDRTILHEFTERAVNHVCFSADGRTLAASLEDLSIHWWSVLTGHELLSFTSASMASGEFYPNLRAFYTGPAELNPGGNLLVWQQGRRQIRATPLPELADIDAVEGKPSQDQ